MWCNGALTDNKRLEFPAPLLVSAHSRVLIDPHCNIHSPDSAQQKKCEIRICL